MDYCTGWFEGWWAHCCAAHDEAYAAQVDRALADNDLFSCVAGLAPDPVVFGSAASVVVAVVMWAGVRVFGWSFYKRAGSVNSAPDSDLR